MSEEKKTKINAKKIGMIAVCAAILCGLGAGAMKTYQIANTSAYLTDREVSTNVYTVGRVDIIGKEPNWDPTDTNNNGVPDKSEHQVPNQELPKDPQIQNVDEHNGAVVFVKVTVPVENVTKVNDDGTKDTKKKQEIFYMKQNSDAASTHENHFHSNWIELASEEIGKGMNGPVRTYVFGYNKVLEPGKTTDPLFQKTQLKNILEGELDSATKRTITINYLAIQSSDVFEQSVDLTKKLDVANLTKIYDIYMNQNPSER